MKKVVLGLILLVASATAFGGETVKCKQELPMSVFEVLRARYVVTIEQTKDITKEIRKIRSVDNAYQVNVTVGTEMENGTNYSEIKKFSAVASNEDVYYTISSVKKNGFSFFLYLDEYDQAGMTLTSKDGSKQKITLNCEE